MQVMTSKRAKTAGPLRAALYARISLVKDDDDTAAVDRQLADAAALAAERGWAVVGEYVDRGESAMTGKRPAYHRLLADVEAGGVDVIVVWSADRLYRRMADLENLVDALGMTRVVTIKSGDVDLSTADGRMVARLLGSVAQRESEKFSERMQSACKQRADRGGLRGGERRFGYVRDVDDAGRQVGPWREVPAEADAIREAAEAVVAGTPLHRVAASWRDRGLTGATGGTVTAGTVRTALLRPDVAGLSAYRGRIVGTLVDHPAILTPEQHHQLVAILTDPSRKNDRRGKPGTTMLGEMLTCGVCGGRLAAQSRRLRTGPNVLTYSCRAGHVARDREPLEAAVSAVVLTYLQRNATALRRPVRRATGAGDQGAAEADTLRRKLAAMPALLAGDDGMDPTDYKDAVKALRERLRGVEDRLARTSSAPVAAALVAAEDVATAWQDTDPATRRAIVRELVETIVVDRIPYRGALAFDGVKVTMKDRAAVAA